MADCIIVTRHQGTVEWLTRNGITGPVKARARRIDVEGKTVYGVLPLILSAYAKEIYLIELPYLPGFETGTELSADQLDEYGARLVRYQTIRTPPPVTFAQANAVVSQL